MGGKTPTKSADYLMCAAEKRGREILLRELLSAAAARDGVLATDRLNRGHMQSDRVPRVSGACFRLLNH